jgi:hypothetical protein
MHERSYLTIWLFFFGLECWFLALIYLAGYDLAWLMQADQTGFSVFILFVFFVGCAFAFRNMLWLNGIYGIMQNDNNIAGGFETRGSVLYYIISSLPALGFLGTVVGVYIITENFDYALKSVTETAKLIGYLQDLVGGMKTAVVTTIIGISSGLLLALLHIVFYAGYVNFISFHGKRRTGSDENTA